MGINTGRVRIQAFMLIGLVSAFAGVVASFYVAYFWPSLGDHYLMSTLAGVFLGGRPSLAEQGRCWERSWVPSSLAPSKLQQWRSA